MSPDLRSVAGLLLYRHLPEEHRYRDNPSNVEMGDLEAYLHGFGYLLDRSRATLEQLYADSFADPVDFVQLARRHGPTGPETAVYRRAIQEWLLPYLADLLGAELIAPDPDARRRELANAVLWSQSRGTLKTIDHLSDVVANAETVTVEGWRRVVTTPNLTLPPFTRPLVGAFAQRRLLRGTPDFRKTCRALATDWPEDPLARGRMTVRNAAGELETKSFAWELVNPEGLPCFPDSFEDCSLRTVDVRTPDWRVGHANPARVVVHVRPPFGFFEPDLARVALGGTALQATGPDEPLVFGPPEALGDPETTLDKLVVEGDLEVTADGPVELHDLLFLGTLTVRAGAVLRLERCAVGRLEIEGPIGETPSVSAHDALFDLVDGPEAFALLEYVTVMTGTDLGKLWASDGLFLGTLGGFSCGPGESCLRFSRLPPDVDTSGCPGLLAPPNTSASPIFMPFHDRDDPDCVLRVPPFGEPGCAVLHPATPAATREGAEDQGEMGAHHHLHHMARLRALERKLAGHAPARVEPVLTPDLRLAAPPPEPVISGELEA